MFYIKMEKEIRDMNVKELKALAKERGIKRYYWLRKAQLIESLETETPPTEAPETEIMEAPENEIMEASENEIMEAPETEIMEAPENEIMEAPENEIMEASENEIMEAPETEIMEAPENEIMEAPENEIMEAPENEIMEAPETEIMDEPVPEIKKPVLSPTKMENISACQWIEKQSELIGRHIHHALCGYGGEYYVYLYAGKEKDSRAREIPVDGYEPESNTIFQYHGCKWHGCPCRKERNSLEEALIAEQRYAKTIELEKKMKEQGFKIVSVWECEKPELKKKRFCKKFRPYPYFIVYDFEAICQKINEKQTDELTITAKHIPVSVAINDNLTKKPSFIVEEDPKKLAERFVVELLKRAREIEETVWLSNPVLGVYKKFNEDDKGEQYGGYLINEARVKLSKETAKSYVNWVKQVPVFGFNSGRYDINMIKEYFVENLTSLSDVNVAKKENSYMFLSTPNFKFLDIKNFLAPGLSYDAWCRAYGCELQKLAFPYEWFDSFEKLNHIGPVKYEEFYSSLKGGITISQEEYQNFCDEFRKRGCESMKDWLKEYNLADVEPFIEALEKTREQYYPDEIDLLKDAVSIPGISMTYVLNKALKIKKKSDPDLFLLVIHVNASVKMIVKK